eukprot:TRINITY_DN67907_c0_g1_i1.p1 TRINITY_DN67907_c0_g1~~TRINITY_DN67907_c0_g1_i1.p1  ORF type:complete len:162 (+),score=34.24 TRINITY_DN67907_c0_g1_i1:73-558(+)
MQVPNSMPFSPEDLVQTVVVLLGMGVGWCIHAFYVRASKQLSTSIACRKLDTAKDLDDEESTTSGDVFDSSTLYPNPINEAACTSAACRLLELSAECTFDCFGVLDAVADSAFNGCVCDVALLEDEWTNLGKRLGKMLAVVVDESDCDDERITNNVVCVES